MTEEEIGDQRGRVIGPGQGLGCSEQRFTQKGSGFYQSSVWQIHGQNCICVFTSFISYSKAIFFIILG